MSDSQRPQLPGLVLAILLAFNVSTAWGQVQAVDDYFTTTGPGFVFVGDALANDLYSPSSTVTLIQSPDSLLPCFEYDNNGQFYLTDLEGCCGLHQFQYTLSEQDAVSEATIFIDVSCGKNDCSLLDMDFTQVNDDNGDGSLISQECFSVCEHAEATAFYPFYSGSTYDWNISGATSDVPGTNAAERVITWGNEGGGYILLEITSAGGAVETVEICVDILAAPEVDFEFDGPACLDASFQFTNLTTGASSYLWDFGDNNTSTDPNPTHSYASQPSSGTTYTVTLTATRINNVPGMQTPTPLCCCSSTISMDVEIDSLSGPKIFCVSTLCAYESSAYWTDANGCDSLIWTATDAVGNGVTILNGQNTDSINVAWGNGPFGTVSVRAVGCTPALCDQPVSVTIPIISTDEDITGPIVVCPGETVVYELPKWADTYYDWQVTGGWVVGGFSGNGEHLVTIQWLGAAGTVGTIHVDYSNSFLAGLIGASACEGIADLDVEVRNRFSINNVDPVCQGDVATFTGSAGDNYDWATTSIGASIAPPSPSNTANVTWNDAGFFTVTATPENPSLWCNTEATSHIQVLGPPETPTIDGPIWVCAGSTEHYTAITSAINTEFTWAATNGTVTSSSTPSVDATWDNLPAFAYVLFVSQALIAQPHCASASVYIQPNALLLNPPYSIGYTDVCANEQGTYSLNPTPHPDATITWSIDVQSGSITGGQGTNAVTIQWNNFQGASGLSATIELCGDLETTGAFGDVNMPAVPTISQLGYLCANPGASVDIEVDNAALYSYFGWSTGASSAAGSTITVTSAGVYEVETTDASNGCKASASFSVSETPAPPANIFTLDGNAMCTPATGAVNLQTLDGSNLDFSWTCQEIGVGTVLQVSSAPTFSHVGTQANTASQWLYEVTVTSNITQCQSTDSFSVYEVDCSGPGGGTGTGGCFPATPQPTVTLTIVPQQPNCNVFNFSASSGGTGTFTINNWDFGDGSTSTSPAPNHTYTQARIYGGTVSYEIPSTVTGQTCTAYQTFITEAPLAADFSSAHVSCDEIDFLDLSTWVSGSGNAANSWLWTFPGGSPSTSAAQHPISTFSPGVHTVLLTVTNSNGCQATMSHDVTIGSIGTVSVGFSPSPACTGETVSFVASAAGATTYTWDFGDGAGLIGTPADHAFQNANATPLSYPIMVTASDALGCENYGYSAITVNPAPSPEVIQIADPIICEDETTTLSVPFTSGYTYAWSDVNGPNASLGTAATAVVGPGVYSVMIGNQYGCSLNLPEVEVVGIPAPIAFISGPSHLCDDCITLTVAAQTGCTYQWNYAGQPLTGETGSTLIVCSIPVANGGYSVYVTNSEGCSSLSSVFTLSQAPPVNVTVQVSPQPACAGIPHHLNALTFNNNLSHLWSTGETVDMIVSDIAGTYTVVATDTITGCKAIADAVIFPLPDLCAMPAGCYTSCNPDTINAPPGYSNYSWSLDGNSIAGGQSIVVTQSGVYTVAVTDGNGCTSVSRPNDMELIDCDSTACAFLSSFETYCIGADVFMDLEICNPNNAVFDVTSIVLGVTAPAGAGVLAPFMTPIAPGACMTYSYQLTGVSAGDFFCFDLSAGTPEDMCPLAVEYCPEIPDCTDEPGLDCLFISSDTVWCEGGQTYYSFTACSPAGASFDVNYIVLDITGSAGVSVDPTPIALGTALVPGGPCQSFTVQLNGPTPFGDVFCFRLVGHFDDPTGDVASLCCSLPDEYCIELPGCDPCESLEFGLAPANPGQNDCCYQLQVVNGYGANAFTHLNVQVISPATSISSISNPTASWNVASLGTTGFSVTSATQNSLPFGSFTDLPTFCIETSLSPNQQIELSWIDGEDVVCRDTVEVFCTPPCGYVIDGGLACVDGMVQFTGSIHNGTTYVIEELAISYNDAGMGVHNTVIPVAPVLPGGNFGPLQFEFGPPAVAGQEICITFTLHELSASGDHLNCCNFMFCDIVPPCGNNEGCACGDVFDQAIAAGFIPTLDAFNPMNVILDFADSEIMKGCDAARWFWGDGSQTLTYGPAGGENHTYANVGEYNVCVKVSRESDTGERCKRGFCDYVGISGMVQDDVRVFPNPSGGLFALQCGPTWTGNVRLSVRGLEGRVIQSDRIVRVALDGSIWVDLQGEPPGVYNITLRSDQVVSTVRAVIQ